MSARPGTLWVLCIACGTKAGYRGTPALLPRARCTSCLADGALIRASTRAAVHVRELHERLALADRTVALLGGTK